MRFLKGRYALGALMVFLLFLTSCMAPYKPPIFLGPGFEFNSIDKLIILPPVDARVEKKVNVNLDKQLNGAAEKILRKKGYRTELSTTVGEVGAVTEEDLKDAKPEWIKRLGPAEARWVMVLVLVDVATKLTFGSTGNAEISGYMFDKEAGQMVWKDKGIGQAGQGGLAGMLMKGMMDEEAIGNAIASITASIPARK
jgi:hypothetical protein